LKIDGIAEEQSAIDASQGAITDTDIADTAATQPIITPTTKKLLLNILKDWAVGAWVILKTLIVIALWFLFIIWLILSASSDSGGCGSGIGFSMGCAVSHSHSDLPSIETSNRERARKRPSPDGHM
jgi:hypothetical protein